MSVQCILQIKFNLSRNVFVFVVRVLLIYEVFKNVGFASFLCSTCYNLMFSIILCLNKLT